MKDPKILQEAADALRDMILTRVREEGKGVKRANGPTSKLAPLSPKYIKERQRDARLSSETTPETSNLTRTGDMLDALETRVSGTKASVYIPPGKQLDKARYTNELRPWVNISKGEATKLRALIAKLVKEKL